MASYRYIARTHAGKQVQGTLEADSEGAALSVLDEQRLFPLEVREQADTLTTSGPRRGVRSRDLGMMYGQLSDLLQSGVPLLRSMDTLARTTVNRRLAEVLRQVRSDVADGRSLTDALRTHPQVFPPLHTAMVQAGERAGFLEDVLSSLATFIERLDELRNKVIGALIYPFVLGTVGIGVLLVGLLYFVPKFESMMGRVAQPFPTVVVFGASAIMRQYWPLLLLATAGAVGLGFTAWRNDASRRRFERWRMKIPGLGAALRMVAITRFCRILGTMLVNGVPLLQALAISRDATGSTLLAERIDAATESVRAGESLSEPLEAGGLFPAEVLAMIRVAEESNKLEKVLLQIADTVERRANRQVDQAVRLIEPLVLCIIAAAIGFMAMGLLLPLFTAASALET